MARNEQLIRQHKILQILERRRYGASLEVLRDSVVEELGLGTLHVRSIRRDIEALQAAGMAIVTEETQSGKVWKLSRVEKGLHKIAITASELIALSMGRDFLLPLVGTQFWQGIEGSGTKYANNYQPAFGTITNATVERCEFSACQPKHTKSNKAS